MIRLTTICLAVCILMINGVDLAPADAAASEGTVDVYVVARQSATPEGEAVSDTLPDSIGAVWVGTSYVVEIWMQDTWDGSMPGGPSPGLTGGEFDLHFTASRSDATALHYEGPFYSGGALDGGTIDNVNGVVDDFCAGTLSSGIGVTPDYARLGYVTFDTSSSGTQDFVLDEAEVARYGLGLVDPSEIVLSGASVNQGLPSARTFTIRHSNMVVGGMINGANLEPEPVPAGFAAGLSGTVDVMVDNWGAPTIIQLQNGSVDVATNYGDGPFRPGIDGDDSADYGDFAFQADVSPTEIIELAIRDLVLGFDSGILPVVGHERFSAEQIQMEVASGALDIRSPAMGGHRYDMTGLSATADQEEMGVLLEIDPSGIYELAFIYERTIDISGLSPHIDAGSYLTLQGTLAAEGIPEPSTFTMLCLGAIGVLAYARPGRRP